MSFDKRQANENKRYKILSKLKLYRRDYNKCALAAEDTSLPESTRSIYKRHLDSLKEEITSCELALDNLPDSYRY